MPMPMPMPTPMSMPMPMPMSNPKVPNLPNANLKCMYAHPKPNQTTNPASWIDPWWRACWSKPRSTWRPSRRSCPSGSVSACRAWTAKRGMQQTKRFWTSTLTTWKSPFDRWIVENEIWKKYPNVLQNYPWYFCCPVIIGIAILQSRHKIWCFEDILWTVSLFERKNVMWESAVLVLYLCK